MRYGENAYIINRGGRKAVRRRSGGAGRPVGAIIAVLLLLTAAICLLVVFLPKLRGSAAQSASAAVGGKTYYFLCTAETEERLQGLLSSQNAMERGGAGYLYNDGKYKVVAAVYAKESDVKTLMTVNPDSFYFSRVIPGGNYSDGDRAVVNYLTGEWFDTLLLAASELDRGNITEAAAEYAAFGACEKLKSLAFKASEKLKSAVLSCDYSPPQTQSVLSYIRYVHVQYVITVLGALS